MITTDKILIIDLEATCWPAGEQQKHQSEIIEIGFAILNTQTGIIEDNEAILIKPTKSTVSPFCTELTTITQDLLDREGISFGEACDLIRKYKDCTWASYGAYDLNMMVSQCTSRGVEYPLSDNHINVKKLFAGNRGLKKPVGMAGALYILDMPLDGTHHRGVDDARNIAKILHWCLTNE